MNIITVKKLSYFLAAAVFSILVFSIQTVTAAGPLDLTGVDNFAILANTYTDSGFGTTLNGDLGYNVAPPTPPIVTGTTFVSPNPVYVSAIAKQASLLASANNPAQSGVCTTTLGVATVLDADLPQPLTPGVYCIGGAASIVNYLTLSGDGTYIFRISGTLDASMFSTVALLGGAKADKVFWVPAGGTTLGDSSIFAGIILSNAAITLDGAIMDGRVLSNGAVTTSGFSNIITAPLVTLAPSVVDTTTSSDCDDCSPPTLGVDSSNFRRVDRGFSYNGHSSNVVFFLTPLVLRTTEVGAVNTAVFKIFEEDAPNEVRHFDLIFGLAKGQVLGDSKVMIELDRSWDEVNTVKVIDPEHALKDVRVETSEGPCRDVAVFKNDCLIVTVYHTFRAPLEFNIMATNVWDEHRNAKQNYFTPGVRIIDKSIAEPEPELEIPGMAVNGTNEDAYKVLISDLNVTKSQVAVGEIVKLSFRVTDGIGNLIPWITPDVGICKESATKPHYLFIKPKSVLAQDIDCPFFHSDFISSSDTFNINLVIPEGIPEGEYKLDVWADTDYAVYGGFIGDHQSVDITVVEPVDTDKIISPLKQFMAGINANDVECKEGLQQVIKSSNNSPACVTPATMPILIERGWAKPPL